MTDKNCKVGKKRGKKKSLKGGGEWVKNNNKKKDKCSICRFELTDGKLVYKLDCGHQFHNKCINDNIQYLSDNNAALLCPLCREKLKDEEAISIESLEEKFLSRGLQQMLASWPYVGTEVAKIKKTRSKTRSKTRQPAWRGGRRTRKKRKRTRRRKKRKKKGKHSPT